MEGIQVSAAATTSEAAGPPSHHHHHHAAAISETQLCKRLNKYLTDNDVFDTSQGIQRRHQLIAYLESLLCTWSQTAVSTSHSTNTNNSATDSISSLNHDSTSLNLPLPKLLSFGSTRLGVQKPDADLDLVALCPRHVSRNDFFLSFPTFLAHSNKQLQGNPPISDIHPVSTAYTPVLKFRIDGLPVDLLFVQVLSLSNEWNFFAQPNNSDHIKTTTITTNSLTSDLLQQSPTMEDEQNTHAINSLKTDENLPLHDSILIGLDEASVRSINGVRVAQMILDLVPHRYHFCQTLRTIKEWAFIHGLYNNALGFLGGIQWAILVAYICKHNPNAKPPSLIKHFFSVFTKWRWPRPVTLCPINTVPPPNVSPLVVWDPQTNPKDSMHLMPIITPAYPSMNASYNVGMPHMRRLQHEFNRADRIIKGIISGEHNWDFLFMSNDFFRHHVHYIQVDIISSTMDDHRAWFGFCESRLRLLINGFEAPECGVQCFPFAKFFHNDAAGQLKSNPIRNIALKETGMEDNLIFISSFYLALRFAQQIESIDLKQNTLEFTSIANSWEDRKEGMDLVIKHVMNKNLPSYVHDSESRESAVASYPPAKRVKR